MRATRKVRTRVGMAAVLAACVTLSGCMSSPTYGTSKTAGSQLFQDLGDVASLSSVDAKRKADVKYAPRPGLVLPGADQRAELAQPQVSVAGKDNPDWVESPEETRKRLSEEAEARKSDPNYRSPLAQASVNGRKLSDAQQLAAYRAARVEQKGAYTDRRYLSDPPAQYRQVADGAVLEDLGEPETKKEARRKKDAAMAKSGSSWWKPFQ